MKVITFEMNFSDVVKVTNSLAVLSSNGIYIASASQHKVFIRITNTLQIFQIYSCVDIVQNILWSADSLFILIILKHRGIVQVASFNILLSHVDILPRKSGLDMQS